MTKLLLDACSLLCFLLDEKEAEEMDSWFKKANQNKVKLYMSLINYGEVCIKIDQFFTAERALEIKDLIKNNLSIQILNCDLKIIETAATIKAKGGLAYPDAIALATSKANNSTLLTKDQEFKKFHKDFQILFL
jgi:predicted nucleic acid-binding protein